MQNKQRNELALLSALVGFGALYGYFGYLILPLTSQARNLTMELQHRTEKIALKQLELKKLIGLETAEKANSALDTLTDHLVTTVPLVPWLDCPAALTQIVEGHNLKAKVKIAYMLPFRGLEKTIYDVWSLRVSSFDALRFGEALAELENRYPLGQVLMVSILQNPESQQLEAELDFQIAVHQ